LTANRHDGAMAAGDDEELPAIDRRIR